jgi:hypothetical protein
MDILYLSHRISLSHVSGTASRVSIEFSLVLHCPYTNYRHSNSKCGNTLCGIYLPAYAIADTAYGFTGIAGGLFVFRPFSGPSRVRLRALSVNYKSGHWHITRRRYMQRSPIQHQWKHFLGSPVPWPGGMFCDWPAGRGAPSRLAPAGSRWLARSSRLGLGPLVLRRWLRAKRRGRHPGGGGVRKGPFAGSGGARRCWIFGALATHRCPCMGLHATPGR